MKKGWEIKKLGEVLVKTEMVDPTKKPEEEFIYLDVSSVNRETKEIEGATVLLGKDAPSRARKLVRVNDVIFATVRPTHSRVALITEEYDGQVCSTGYFVLRGKENIDNKYLFYFLLTDEFNRQMEKLQKGASYPAVTDAEVKSIFVRYPKSLPEQQCIVFILDEAFAAIAKAKANAEQNLKNAKELFESYLQGLFENKGEGWEEYRFEDLCDLITCGVASTPKYVDESIGVPFLSAQNVRDGEVVLDKYRYISKQFHQELTKKNKPSKGDILYSRVGSKFGEAGVVEHDFEFSVYVSLTLIKPKPNKLNNYYLKYYLNSPLIKAIAKKSISSSGVPNLNVKEVREFPIKCPSILIQKKIVNEIEMVSTETKRLEAIYQKKIDDLDELKKSILQKAFAGELKTEKEIAI